MKKLSIVIVYYLKQIRNKFTILTECYKGKFSLFIAEILWTLRLPLNLSPSLTLPFFRNYYHTKYGKFYVNPDLQSIITVSPAFEREDINYLLVLMDNAINKDKKVLFIDVGAHIGIYSVIVGNRFKKYSKLQIVAFEPNAKNFFVRNYDLLLKNLKINNIKRIKVHKIGLGNKKHAYNKKYEIELTRLDDVLSSTFAKKFDVVFMKMDIEGYETAALEGAGNFLSSANEVCLLVEDYIDRKLAKFLKRKFIFLKKTSLLNSFWVYNNEVK